MLLPDNILTVVLTEGGGDELHALTQTRTKAAIPFAGEYRLIDFALTNCLHSGLRKVLVLTGQRSSSLERHIRDGWTVFKPELGEHVTPISPGSFDDSRGSGMATLRDHFHVLERARAEHVLLVRGDHVYRMDYAAMLDVHARAGADVTVGCGVTSTGSHLGFFERAPDGQATRYLSTAEGQTLDDNHLASMQVYAFRKSVLLEVLQTQVVSLALDVLPELVNAGRVQTYQFGGESGRVSQDRYWNDIISIDEFFKANMALLEPFPPLDLYQGDWPIWSYSGKNPPARTVASSHGNEGIFVNSIVSNGSVITGGAVSHSVLSPRVRVQDSATVEHGILFSGVTVEEGAELRRCIVDKGARISASDRIGFDAKRDAERFHVTELGVVVVPKGFNS